MGLSALEHKVAAIWAECLPNASIAPDSDFFGLGGDSLQMMNMLFRLEEQLGCEIAPGLLFEHPTLRDFSDAIGRHQAGKQTVRDEGVV